jgi:tRNA (cmo5U34)-methyltransferase
MGKSTVEEIRERFDADVERFSNLETGQSATMDAALALYLIARSATQATPGAQDLLDIGCGAGNYSLKTLEYLPSLSITLNDLSLPMLIRAGERLAVSRCASVARVQADIRAWEPGEERFDIILAAAVLHHLRTPAEWERVFEKLFRALRPGGGLWIFDLVAHESEAIQNSQRERYSEYLVGFQGEAYRDKVFGYIEKEDTPVPLTYQLELLRKVGFSRIDVLHKNGPFAAFGAVK